jgi:hypothetical protein
MPKKAKRPLFNWISANDKIATARGGGGGAGLVEAPIARSSVSTSRDRSVLFVLAAGIKPWMRSAKVAIAPEQRLVIADMKRFNGTMPNIPLRIEQSSDLATKALPKVMRKCYRFGPKARPSARQIARFLEAEAKLIYLSTVQLRYTPAVNL